MADILFDTGCRSFPQETVSVRRAVSTSRAQGFVVSREVYERAIRIITLHWDNATHAEARMLRDLYRDSWGGVTPMDYTPSNGEAAFDVVFAAKPLIVKHTNSRTYSMQAELEEYWNP